MVVRLRNMKSILILMVLLVLVSSTVIAFSYEDKLSYINKKYPQIEEQDIKLQLINMKYVTWAGLYTPYKIQLNMLWIWNNYMLDYYIEHELKHHYCYIEGRLDMNDIHDECFETISIK